MKMEEVIDAMNGDDNDNDEKKKWSMEMMAQSWSNLLCMIFPAENAKVMAILMETESDVVNMGIYEGSQQMMTS